MSLREELERIASAAPTADVSADTWARARRARRRETAGLVTAVVAAALVVAGSLAWLPTRDTVGPADSDSLGVPDRLYAVPERMSERNNDGAWMRDEVSSDIAVGTAAAAWVTRDGLPVVVGARDGAYHLLDLPDFAGNNETFTRGLGNPVVALSPDGRRLAYGYAVFGPTADTEPIPSGVRVVDLTSGELREVPVPGAEGTAVSRIEWSPDGRWIAFAGRPQGTWTRYSMGTSSSEDGRAVLGRIAPTAARAEVRRIPFDEIGIAVDEAGVVTFQPGGLRRWDGRQTVSLPDRRRIDLELGNLGDGSLLQLTGDSAWEAGSADLVTPGGDHRAVIALEPGIGDSLSVATDLMTTEHPTVERAEPRWPWSTTEVFVAVALSVTGAILLVAALWWWWRRVVAGRHPS